MLQKVWRRHGATGFLISILLEICQLLFFHVKTVKFYTLSDRFSTLTFASNCIIVNV